MSRPELKNVEPHQGDDYVTYTSLNNHQDPTFYLPLTDQLLISSESRSDMVLKESTVSFLLKKTDHNWSLLILSGTIKRNRKVIPTDWIDLQLGDELTADGYLIKVYPKQIDVTGSHVVSENLLPLEGSQYTFYENYPDYHRSPRLIYRLDERNYQVMAPPIEPTKPRYELLKMLIPPLVMFGVTLLIAIFQPRGIYILMSIVSSIMTVVLSVYNYHRSKLDYQRSLKERMETYRVYLSDKSVELTKIARLQREGQQYHYPDVIDLSELAQNFSHRIYEKAPQHTDFLYYRLGLGQVPTCYQLSYSQTERSGLKDPLEMEGYRLYQLHQTLTDMPIVANLIHGPIGYIGQRQLVLEQLMLMVNQLAFFHSYHDVQIITVMSENEKPQWEWMRWLPHASLRELNVRGFIYNQRTRDQILNSLHQLLKLRQSQVDEAGTKDNLFLPHYVVIVTDVRLVMDHGIMAFFNEDPTCYGVSLIIATDVMSSLPENIKTVISIKDRQTGQLVLEQGQLREIDFTLDHFPEGFDKEALPRRLAPLKHLQNFKSSIPDIVTFMELYGAESFEDLKVLERWEKNVPYRSLSVPLGLRGQGDIVCLDLHEKAHGPHGLVSGTTGSGKSEIIQSYILSLAVNFHPHDVAFLLIDYKGGGMANLFKDLPHLLGTITNLDGQQSLRALASINAELKRRQHLFAQHEVNHINQYQKKYKLGEAKEPLPHLFLISDEFAELKQNQPDFMAELISTSRIGRSLGIHLILATQKPAGVVNDQIWSNSRFKLALKVEDKQDSVEILKTADAADITQPGRAYLQVGNNEVYELFQSAWSGAEYQKSKDDQGIEDHTIYTINDLGQYEALNQDLSGLENVEAIRQIPTEIEVIVENLNLLIKQEGLKPLPQPWLPPLQDKVYLDDLIDTDYLKQWQISEPSSLQINLGIADVPEKQSQHPVWIDLTKDGNMAMYGGVGYGKTTFLQTAIMNLLYQQSPEQMHLYLLDFGSNGLSVFDKAPHVADRLCLDEPEKVAKFIRMVLSEFNRRKTLLSEYGVGTLKQYRAVTKLIEPSMVIVLDAYDAIKDEPFEDDLFKLLVRLAREGLALGIHLILSASRQSSLRPTLYSHFKHQLTLRQNDVNEVMAVVGRTPLAAIEDIKGRALIKLEGINSLQVALPVNATSEIHRIEKIRQVSTEMANSWRGKRPSAIPMLPDQLTNNDFECHYPSVQQAIARGCIPLGLDEEAITAQSWDISSHHLLYLYEKEIDSIQIVNHLRSQLIKQGMSLTLVTSIFSPIDWHGTKAYADIDAYKELINDLNEKLYDRLHHKQERVTQVIVWYNYDEIVTQLDEEAKAILAHLFDKGHRAGLANVVITRSAPLNRLQDVASRTVKNFRDILLTVRVADQVIVSPTNRPVREPMLADQEAYLVSKGFVTKIKVPLVKEGLSSIQ